LFDTEGRVIGVNSQIYSRSGGYMGLSFAIPINVTKNIVEQLKAKGYASRGWLGVMIQNVDQALAESFGLKKPEGALVAQITPDSPAESSGLEVGDIILAFNGLRIGRSSDLPPAVGSTPVDATVPVEVMRGGKRKTLSVTVGELQEPTAERKNASLQKSDNSGIGATVQALSDDEKKQSGISDGLVILEVDPEGPSAKTGIRPGDILVSFNRETVNSVDQLKELIGKAPRDQSFPVLIQREGSPIFLAMTLDKG
jgi:serine protease Do